MQERVVAADELGKLCGVAGLNLSFDQSFSTGI
jgi:hypothetical protein